MSFKLNTQNVLKKPKIKTVKGGDIEAEAREEVEEVIEFAKKAKKRARLV